MLWNLKSQIVDLHGSQVVAARRLGIEETRLSRIVREHIQPRDDERAKLIDAFGASALKPSDRSSGDRHTSHG
jgi:plasmid maintenance system antidote protein VapI